MELKPAQVAELTMAVNIAAPPAKVWKSLTQRINDWWPSSFFAGGTEGKRRYILETIPGGRMYEEWDAGGGLLWGTVIAVEPNALLQILGATFPNWGGPNQSYSTWKLSASEDSTTLTFSESILGSISDPDCAEKRRGWEFLLSALQAHVEGGPAPVWT